MKQFVTEQGESMEYTVAYESAGDVSKAYSKAFGESGIPHAFIVDQSGKIVWVGHPMGMDGVLKDIVEGSYDPVAYAEKKKKEKQLYANLRKWQGDYFAKIGSDNNDETRKLADQIIENGSSSTLNGFAWKILTEVKKENRDLPAALKAAEKSSELAGGKNPAVLDTYGLALFKNGKVAEAIAQQTKAIELSASDPAMQEGLKKRLEEFKAAK